MILCGDVLDQLRSIPNGSIHCVITSPPYYGLRDYGIEGQIGLESSPDEYVAKMVTVFQEVRRVLRNDGTCWLNLGDSYTANRSYQVPDNKHCDVGNHDAMHVPDGIKPKDLIGIPWRVAFALQTDGWWLRSDIIWSKNNSMPESVTDRPTKSHEYLFLLTKSVTYYYDHVAVMEPLSESTIGDGRTQRATRGTQGVYSAVNGNCGFNPAGRNLRSVWTINTQPFSGAHFAAFPPKLVEPCILAGTSERGCCAECGKPWRRVVEKGLTAHDGNTQTIYPKRTNSNCLALLRQASRERGGEYINQTRTIDWQPTCTCNAMVISCTVLDPFAGSGTTASVAQRLGRNWIAIELNPEYISLIKQRTQQPSLLVN